MDKEDQKSCTEQLEQLKNEFNEFMYIVSHDLKAPIRAISNLSVWIKEDLEDSTSEDVSHNLNLLRNRAIRLEHMIEAILKLSRVSSSVINLEEVNMHELVNSVSAHETYKDKVQLILDRPLPSIVGSKENLRFIWEQLLQNAINFNNESNLQIYIDHKITGTFYQIEVADNGCGIPETALDKIFKLFYTVAPKDSINTTGAGLTVARKMVQVMGGEMWASNNRHGGLSIYFTLPLN